MGSRACCMWRPYVNKYGFQTLDTFLHAFSLQILPDGNWSLLQIKLMEMVALMFAYDCILCIWFRKRSSLFESVIVKPLWNQPRFVTISHTTASLSWSSAGLTAMVNMVALDCLVHLNSLMHVAGAGLLSQHGWDGGIHACLQHSCM